MKKNSMTPALKFFFRTMEKKSQSLEAERQLFLESQKEVSFEEIERFFRALKSQNIFIHTVGASGKPVSMLLEKAVFSLNSVIRIYYSTSFDEVNQGYVRIQVDDVAKLVAVERMHGYRPVPELLYASHDECHVIRFMVRWIMRRIDWDKTRLDNLDLYKRYVENQREEIEQRLMAEIEEQQERELQEAMEKHFGKKRTDKSVNKATAH